MEAVDTLGDAAEGRKHMLEKDVAQDDQLGVSLDMWLHLTALKRTTGT